MNISIEITDELYGLLSYLSKIKNITVGELIPEILEQDKKTLIEELLLSI